MKTYFHFCMYFFVVLKFDWLSKVLMLLQAGFFNRPEIFKRYNCYFPNNEKQKQALFKTKYFVKHMNFGSPASLSIYQFFGIFDPPSPFVIKRLFLNGPLKKTSIFGIPPWPENNFYEAFFSFYIFRSPKFFMMMPCLPLDWWRLLWMPPQQDWVGYVSIFSFF